jgi:hypothetical protein
VLKFKRKFLRQRVNVTRKEVNIFSLENNEGGIRQFVGML